MESEFWIIPKWVNGSPKWEVREHSPTRAESFISLYINEFFDKEAAIEYVKKIILEKKEKARRKKEKARVSFKRKTISSNNH